jgi:hypothetical protein
MRYSLINIKCALVTNPFITVLSIECMYTNILIPSDLFIVAKKQQTYSTRLSIIYRDILNGAESVCSIYMHEQETSTATAIGLCDVKK